jgi:hypothetical protein
MTERRFVLVDFSYASDVMGHVRFYEAGNTYDMPRALAHAAAKRELGAQAACASLTNGSLFLATNVRSRRKET